jgi:PAN domain
MPIWKEIGVAVLAWQLVIYAFMLATCTSGLSKYCPLMGLDGQMVYSTDIPWRTNNGVSQSECALQCALTNAMSLESGDVCRCFNYNSAAGNCNLFNVDPMKYAVDSNNNINTYEVRFETV